MISVILCSLITLVLRAPNLATELEGLMLLAAADIIDCEA